MRPVIIASITLIVSLQGNAQINEGKVSFQASFPQGAYKKNYPVTATGLMFSGVHRLKETPAFGIGGEIGILEVRTAKNYFTGTYNNIYGTFLFSSWNAIITFAPIARVHFMEQEKDWDVWMDITVGLNIFLTTSSISRDLGLDRSGNPVVQFYYLKFRTDYSCRAGTGIGIEKVVGKNKKVGLFLKGSFLYGSQSSYYGKATIVDTNILLSPKSSKTTMALVEAGIGFGIFNKKDR